MDDIAKRIVEQREKVAKATALVRRFQERERAEREDLRALERTAELMNIAVPLTQSGPKAECRMDQVVPLNLGMFVQGERQSVGVTGKAVDILREQGRPMHVDEIIRIMASRGIVTKKRTLSSTFAQYALHRKFIRRTKQPNTFEMLPAGTPGVPSEPSAGSHQGRTATGQIEYSKTDVIGAIMRTLEASRPKPLGATDIQHATGVKLISVRSALVRLASERRIRRVEYGRYTTNVEESEVSKQDHEYA